MQPVDNSKIYAGYSLVQLKSWFPNPIDLRQACYKTPDGDIFRKICIRDLTNLGRIREAYLFAKEIEDFKERDVELNGLIPACVAMDEIEVLKDLFTAISPYRADLARYECGLGYFRSGNLSRFLEMVFSISEIALNDHLIFHFYNNTPNPLNAQFLGRIIETYLADYQAEYALYLIRQICPKLNPNAPVEDMLFAAGEFLIREHKFNQIHLVVNTLTHRKQELIDRILVPLLDQGEIPVAIEISRNFSGPDNYLYLIGNYLHQKGLFSQIHLVINVMNEGRSELLQAILPDLLNSGNVQTAYHLINNLNRDKEVLIQYISQYVSKNR